MPFGNKAPWLRTIGARLTLCGTGISLLICAILCVVLYFGLSYSLRSEIDRFLEGEISEFSTILRDNESADPRKIEADIRSELGSRPRGDLNFRLITATGDLLITGARIDRVPVPWRLPPIDNPREAGSSYLTLDVGHPATQIRVCSQWIQLNGVRHLAQTTYTLDGVSNSLAGFRMICIIALLSAAILSFAGGHALSKQLLRPVQRMTDSARSITAACLSERLHCGGSNDELDRLAETLNEMLDRIQRHFRQMQQFTADAAHELRTPLAALRGAAEIALTNQRSPDELRQTLQDSVDRFDQLSRIADDLLLLARLDSGDQVLRLEHIRLDIAVDDVIDLYQPYAAERGIDIRFNPREETWVNADAGRIRQVLGNLIDNSVKYMSGPGKVIVGLLTVNGHLVLSVRDNGPGIPDGDLPHIFDRFFRGDRARSRGQRQGSGLGLPICRSIIHAHGGTITARSESAQGTEIVIQLAALTSR